MQVNSSSLILIAVAVGATAVIAAVYHFFGKEAATAAIAVTGGLLYGARSPLHPPEGK